MARVFQTTTPGEAHIRAALVETPGRADLCVRRVSSWGLARGDTLWYITRDRQEATVRVWFGSEGEAQLRVCFVEDYGATGWTRSHPLKGRLG